LITLDWALGEEQGFVAAVQELPITDAFVNKAGSLALYGGLTSFYSIADPMYYVTAGAIYPLMAVWVWNQARRRIAPRSEAKT
jgi:hypothetical protein